MIDKHDELIFSIYESDESVAPLLTKRTNLGIQVSNNGSYRVDIPGNELNLSTFSRKYYRYALQIVMGDSGERNPVVTGDFTLKNLPA